MTGTADALADCLSREPLRKQAGLSIDPATIKGQAEGDLALDLKLGKTARPEDTQFHASGALVNLSSTSFSATRSSIRRTATFDADRNTLKLVGDGQVFGAPTHIDVARRQARKGRRP